MSQFARGIYVFYEYGDGSHVMAYSYFDGNNWTVNQVVPNTGTSGPPSLILGNDGELYCFHDGGGNLWYNVFDGVNWRGDWQVDDTNVSHSPSAISYNNQTYVFHQGADDNGNSNGELWYNIYQGGGNWSGDNQVPNTSMHHSPAAILWNSEILCFHMGTGGADHSLWVNSYSHQSQWPGDNPVDGPWCANSPALLSYNGSLLCFYQGGANALTYGQVQLGNPDAINGQSVPSTLLWYSPAPCTFNNRIYCFHHSTDATNT